MNRQILNIEAEAKQILSMVEALRDQMETLTPELEQIACSAETILAIAKQK